MDNKEYKRGCNHKTAKHGRGPSSYWMHESKEVFNSLALKAGDCFLDMGCGPGDYSIEASKIVGNSGIVYALDRNQVLIEQFIKKANTMGIENLITFVTDITKPLPLPDNSIDVCFISTVLHIPAVTRVISAVFNEVCRILKPGKRLAIIECKKEEMPFGPPKHMRLSPADIEKLVQEYDLKKLNELDLGYNYMIQFVFNPNETVRRDSFRYFLAQHNEL